MTKQPLTRDLAEVMESLRRTLEAKKGAATPETPQNAPKQSAVVIHLPLWPEPARGVPNDVLRSALFAAIHKSRKFIKHRLIAAYDGNQIEYRPLGSNGTANHFKTHEITVSY